MVYISKKNTEVVVLNRVTGIMLGMNVYCYVSFIHVDLHIS